MGTEAPEVRTELVAGAIRAARTVARGAWRERWVAWADAWLAGPESRSAASAEEAAGRLFVEPCAPHPEDEWWAIWSCIDACHAARALAHGWPEAEQYARNVIKRLAELREPPRTLRVKYAVEIDRASLDRLERLVERMEAAARAAAADRPREGSKRSGEGAP